MLTRAIIAASLTGGCMSHPRTRVGTVDAISPGGKTRASQNAPTQSVIYLRDITNIERTDLKPYCLILETNQKRYFLSLKSDEELYSWQDDVYSRSPLMSYSSPTNFVHKVHVGFDPVSGAFTVR